MLREEVSKVREEVSILRKAPQKKQQALRDQITLLRGMVCDAPVDYSGARYKFRSCATGARFIDWNLYSTSNLFANKKQLFWIACDV